MFSPITEEGPSHPPVEPAGVELDAGTKPTCIGYGSGEPPAGPAVSPRRRETKCDADRGPELDQEPQQQQDEPTRLVMGLLMAVSALEGADAALLPAVMKAWQKDIGFHLENIAYLAVAQAVLQNLAAPFWGILADRGVLRRKSILVIGALGQGTVTILLAFSYTLGPMIALRAAAGTFLAALRPISNGLIADMTQEHRRGKIFGRVQAALLLGMFVSGIVAVNMANKQLLGSYGWRFAFVLIGLLGASVALLVAIGMVEPPRRERAAADRSSTWCQAIGEEIRELTSFLCLPTFGVIVVQGIFGTIPWTVMGNMVLYFQLSGLSDAQASVLNGESPLAGAVGNVIGGYVSDALTRCLGLHGRPLNAQLTVAMGIPLIYFIFYGIPPGRGSFFVYFLLIGAFGLLGTWAQSGTNFPVLSQIVPSSARSRIMAWEVALENSIASALGPPVVALLATKAFGYKFGEKEATGASLESARALGQAMTVVICIPWLVCLAAYSSLHWSYPRDVRRLQAAMEAEKAEREVKAVADGHAESSELELAERREVERAREI